MKQEIEIELKNLVTEEEFNSLCAAFSISDDSFIEQTNHYFDTEDFSLKEKGCALRIRHKKNNYTFTLKRPQDDGLLEAHEVLSEATALNLINGRRVDPSEMLDLLEDTFGIESSKLKCLGSLVTSRVERAYKSGLLVFDHSTYLGTEDFELEYEVGDRKTGEQEFHNLLETYHIPQRNTPNKIERFFNRKRV
ncbi:CYTH domain-containing protein [Alkalihalobacillus sp. TS-13]|uniref:CYTH domain-containing protein n=1 Tax=Alkalihalobacillus sp. TS-13 TaxID=2842455 RepID=UPI001C87EA56|nr:CYTH domain-containing protein [Alkalihalobacillus sp. TS-13]